MSASENYATFTNRTLQKVEVNLPRSNERSLSRADIVVDRYVVIVFVVTVHVSLFNTSLLSAAFVRKFVKNSKLN